MNELFKGEILEFPDDDDEDEDAPLPPLQELRFKGDRAAFVNADFWDFYWLLDNGHVIWLTDNVLVSYLDAPDHVKKALINRGIEEDEHDEDRSCEQIGQRIQFGEDLGYNFQLCSLKKLDEADTAVLDMLLESLGRLQIQELYMTSDIIMEPQKNTSKSFCFSAEAFSSFLAGNEKFEILTHRHYNT
jgi:hypothetical protein